MSIELRTEQPLVQDQKYSTLKVAAKALLVAAIVAGLAAAVFFSGGAMVAFIGAGAAAWQIGLLATALAASTISLIGTGYFAAKHEMFEDTGHNLADSGRFVRDTVGAGVHALMWGVEAVKEWQIWDMITDR